MPCSRKQDLESAVNIFLSQTYTDKELILVVPDTSFIPQSAPGISRYIHKASLGDLRNYAIEHSTGDIICTQDSDDWYAPEYINESVKLLVSSNADLVGLNKAVFISQSGSWQYDYKGSQKLVLGATMCYWKRTWQDHPFRPIQVGEDNVFCAMTRNVAYGDYTHLFTAHRHDNNTSFPDFNSSSFTRIK